MGRGSSKIGGGSGGASTPQKTSSPAINNVIKRADSLTSFYTQNIAATDVESHSNVGDTFKYVDSDLDSYVEYVKVGTNRWIQQGSTVPKPAISSLEMVRTLRSGALKSKNKYHWIFERG